MSSGGSTSPIPFGLSLKAALSSRGLIPRILLLTLLFVAELVMITVWLDDASLVQRAGLIGIMHDWGAWILRCIVGFAVIFLTFAYLKNKAALQAVSAQIERIPFGWSFFAAHGAAMSLFVALSFLVYEGSASDRANLLAVGWFVAGILAILFAGVAFLPAAAWVQLVRKTGYLWAYSLAAVVSACAAGNMVRRLWQPASYLTLHISKMLLGLFVSGVIADPATMTIGTPRFHVEIAPQCSGLEGVGLILAFGILWLLVFRKECQFPRSLVLIPFGITLIFLLNSVRIAALVLIGNAGAEQVALGGFHSQAGWIAFSAVGVGFCFVVQRVPWFTTRPPTWESLDTARHNPTAAFLLPFLAILAAGMIASAAKSTGDLEWLYPLRLVAAVGMLWVFRRSYASLSWRCDWVAPVVGAIVFAVWIGLDHASPNVDRAFSDVLMTYSASARVVWIAVRVLAAVVTVPLSEELAFRGYLMRRLVSSDFEAVCFRRFSWFALLASSVIFGLLHGGYWIAGIIAGILLGLVVIRRGRIGDAVVAHATANALLAVYVLIYHKWHLW